MTDNYCFMCYRSEVQNSAWPLDSLKFLIEGDFFKICKPHSDFCVKRIVELQAEAPKKVILKTGPKVNVNDKYQADRFLPPIIKAEKSRYEREPGEDG